MIDALSLTFSALSDPTRRAILARLIQGETTVSELAKPFLKAMSLPAVTKHLKVLENAGLIVKGRDAQRRPCRLNPDALKHAVDWMEQYRVFWEESFDRLDEHLKTVMAERRAAASAPQAIAADSATITVPSTQSSPPRERERAKSAAKQSKRVRPDSSEP